MDETIDVVEALRRLSELEDSWQELRARMDASFYVSDTAIVREERLWDEIRDIKHDLDLCLNFRCRILSPYYAYCEEHGGCP